MRCLHLLIFPLISGFLQHSSSLFSCIISSAQITEKSLLAEPNQPSIPDRSHLPLLWPQLPLFISLARLGKDSRPGWTEPLSWQWLQPDPAPPLEPLRLHGQIPQNVIFLLKFLFQRHFTVSFPGPACAASMEMAVSFHPRADQAEGRASSGLKAEQAMPDVTSAPSQDICNPPRSRNRFEIQNCRGPWGTASARAVPTQV